MPLWGRPPSDQKEQNAPPSKKCSNRHEGAGAKR
jgi:hypothetical protein